MHLPANTCLHLNALLWYCLLLSEQETDVACASCLVSDQAPCEHNLCSDGYFLTESHGRVNGVCLLLELQLTL